MSDENLDELRDLWERKAAGDIRARDELVKRYVWLAKRLAYTQQIPDHVERDELISWALKGLMEQVDRFDISRSDGSLHKHFTAVASLRIRGAILDGLKSPATSWAPRSTWRQLKAQRAMEDDLQQSLGRPPTRDELAAGMGVEVRNLVSLQLQVPAGATSEGEDHGLETIAGGDRTDQESEMLGMADRLASSICSLEPDQQRILTDVFFRHDDGLTPAKRLGVTVPNMKRMRTEALKALRGQLQSV